MNYNYVQLQDIKQKILHQYRFDFWMDEGACFAVETDTRRTYKNPNKWMSIGLLEPDQDATQSEEYDIPKKYRPLWDIYAPTENHKKIIQTRLRTVCLALGGHYADGFGPIELPDTDVYEPENKANK